MAEEGEEVDIQPRPLTVEVAAGGLSSLKDVGHLAFNYTKLDLVGKSLIDLAELHRYTSLQLLDVSDNQIADAAPISKLPGLLSGKLNNNKIESISNLAEMESLQLLSLKGNALTEVTQLNTPMLLYLNVDGNQIATLSNAFQLASKLSVLEARENKLTTTAGIENLQELEEAHFSTNEIADLCLGSMPQLRKLSLNGNQIATLSAFQNNASSLEHLDLSTNIIESAKELVHLEGLKRLRTLSFAENAITGVDKYRNHVHAVLPQLETLDGEPFSEEDREPPPPPIEEDPPAE